MTSTPTAPQMPPNRLEGSQPSPKVWNQGASGGGGTSPSGQGVATLPQRRFKLQETTSFSRRETGVRWGSSRWDSPSLSPQEAALPQARASSPTQGTPPCSDSVRWEVESGMHTTGAPTCLLAGSANFVTKNLVLVLMPNENNKDKVLRIKERQIY